MHMYFDTAILCPIRMADCQGSRSGLPPQIQSLLPLTQQLDTHGEFVGFSISTMRLFCDQNVSLYEGPHVHI